MTTIKEQLDDAERRQAEHAEEQRIEDEIDAMQATLEAMGVPEVDVNFAEYVYLEEMDPDRLKTFLTYERERFETMEPDHDDDLWRSIGSRITSGYALLARAGG